MALRRDRMMLIGGIVIGAAAVILAAVLGPAIVGGNDAEAPIHLQQANSNSPCAVTVKAQIARVRQNRKIVWEIANYCGSQQVLTVGNFRTVESPSDLPANCETATHGGAAWLFQDDENNVDRRRRSINAGNPYDPKERDLDLKVKQGLGSAPLDYYYDICLGGTKADPKLIIDP